MNTMDVAPNRMGLHSACRCRADATRPVTDHLGASAEGWLAEKTLRTGGQLGLVERNICPECPEEKVASGPLGAGVNKVHLVGDGLVHWGASMIHLAGM